MLILFGSGIFTLTYASVESEAQEDLLAGCRDEQTLVYRFAHHDYVCVEPATAKRWVELKIAEIKQNSTSKDVEKKETGDSDKVSKYPGAPVPPPEKLPFDSNSECREGQVLVYRFTHQDTFCMDAVTAINWERLGLVQSVDSEYVIDDEKNIPKEKEERIEVTVSEEVTEEVTEEKNIESSAQIIDDLSQYPKIYPIERGVWGIVDYDKSTSVFIEGDSGIIVINSLNSYTSTKKALSEFKTISNYEIKAIVLTTINPDLTTYNAFIEERKDVPTVFSNMLLDSHESESIIPNPISYKSEFSINVANIEINLNSRYGFNSTQTVISLPEYDGILVGDSKKGVFPIIFDEEHFQIFNDDS